MVACEVAEHLHVGAPAGEWLEGGDQNHCLWEELAQHSRLLQPHQGLLERGLMKPSNVRVMAALRATPRGWNQAPLELRAGAAAV